MEGEGALPELNGVDAMDWCYRGEGAANIVLAYQGSDPLLVGKVLRLKKIALDAKHLKSSKVVCEPGQLVLTEEEQKVWADWPSVATAMSLETLIKAYTRDVMSPLLGSEHVDPGVLVRVSREFLETVACNVHHARPSSRANASQIDILSSSALLISDHSVFWSLAGTEPKNIIFPSISVEIKPKCGFLPSSALIAAKNSIKKKVPRFTMHQILKLTEGQVKVLSHYSPLDLFSENLERINQAVHCLLDNPQNNLRVFVGGTLISGSDAEPANWQALTEAFGHKNQADPVEALKELVAQSLYETNAIRNLLAVQKLDTLDIEGAIHAYYKICHRNPIEHLHGSTFNKLDESVEHEAGTRSVEALDGMSLVECRRIVRDYLIAATAKDCSLMLTLQQVPDTTTKNTNMQCHKLVFSSKTDKFFRLKINFVDLDLKSLSKMPHYYHIDQEIVTAYLTATHGATKCSDPVHENNL
eukprot:c19817_g1_i1 orf=550-1965(-)